MISRPSLSCSHRLEFVYTECCHSVILRSSIATKQCHIRRPHLKDRGKVIFSVCLSVHTEWGTPVPCSFTGRWSQVFPGAPQSQVLSQVTCTVPFTVQPFAYTSCTSRLRASQGSHRMGDQWYQL